MPKCVIEREIPGAGDLSVDQLQFISQKSCEVLRGLGPQIPANRISEVKTVIDPTTSEDIKAKVGKMA